MNKEEKRSKIQNSWYRLKVVCTNKNTKCRASCDNACEGFKNVKFHWIIEQITCN